MASDRSTHSTDGGTDPPPPDEAPTQPATDPSDAPTVSQSIDARAAFSPAEATENTDDRPTVPGFEVTTPLGEGGNGVVWRAVQTSTGRPVALKVMSLRRRGSERALKRFQREFELASKLSHPNIAGVYEAGERDGQWYYAMQLVHGLPLDRYIADERLNVHDAIALLHQVADAVHHAHECRIVHRDLKPSNVVVTPEGVPLVLDFGLAREISPRDTEGGLSVDGSPMGTLAYMAPEQAAGRHRQTDARTDVYALGVMLYYILTKTHPFTGDFASVVSPDSQ